MAGVKEALVDERNLWPLIERRAGATPQALFAVDERERRLSFADYRNASLRCAAGLAAAGIAEGTAVSWQLPTCLEAMVLVGGLARLGALQNPILPFLREREVDFITRQIGARFLFVPPVFRGFDHAAMARKVAERSPALEVIVVDAERGLPEGDPASLPPPPRPATTGGEAPLRWIFYSSGTTADPKGARHTDFSVAGPGRSICRVLDLQPDDRNALVFPFTHIGGIGWLFAGLMAGIAHIVVEVFDPERTVDVLARHSVTQAGAGTAFHQAYLAVQRARGGKPIFPEVRTFPGGGAPRPPGLHAQMKRELGGAGVVSGYGLTEYPIVAMCSVGDPEAMLATTEGHATEGTEIRILRADGNLAAPGEEGEIRVRGPHLFRGYVGERLDAEAMDAAGFLRTGDLGRLDAQGYLTISGRLKDVIIRKGENISAKELEDALSFHPAVAEVAVIGLPDEERGERACAVVVPKEPSRPPALGDLCAFLLERGLAKQKLPEQLELADTLPRNASGKVLKRELQERIR